MKSIDFFLYSILVVSCSDFACNVLPTIITYVQILNRIVLIMVKRIALDTIFIFLLFFHCKGLIVQLKEFCFVPHCNRHPFFLYVASYSEIRSVFVTPIPIVRISDRSKKKKKYINGSIEIMC